MNTWLKASIVYLAAMNSCFLFASEENDPILDKLTKAKATYQTDLEKYHASVGAYFDKREEIARKNGDKKTVDQIKSDRQEFDDEGNPAKLPAALKSQLTSARSAMEIAYKTAIREYVKTKQDDKSAGVEEELATFTKGIDNDAFIATASGLKYRIRRKGDGTRPKSNSTVNVHYKGWLDGGRVFDSSYGRGKPADLKLDSCIKGWTEGMQLIGKGGMIELQIPPELAYGDKGSPPAIPPKSTLYFSIELLDVK
ncbi:MAG TPA: FKBP-type peptidyl-prolyl cis-trans isomerase [Schlesneria sp.]